MEKELPKEINEALEGLKKEYVNSPATTKAGTVIRTIVKFIPLTWLLKALVHKIDK